MKMKLVLLLSCILLLICPKVFALNFHKSEETLNRITEIISKKEKGVYLRFGDGDVVLANGQDDGFQKNNSSLQQEMREAFSLNGPNVLKCLPLGCKEFGGFEEGMFPGNHEQPYEWCVDMINMAAPIWNGEIEDIYSMTALAQCATSNLDLCIKFMKFLKASNCCVFVGNCNIPASLRELMFGPQCQYVPTPDRNSYYEIDRIEQECLEKVANKKGYKIIVTSMGCSGRALQKRLWQKLDNVFLFDFGSLMDAICGWNTRDWIALTHFDCNNFQRLLERELGSVVPQKEGQIRIVCTSALIPLNYEMRKEEYITTIKMLKGYGYDPYFFEACHPASPSFLDEYVRNICYSNVNDYRLINKGVNEATSMMVGFKQFHFDDNDMIVKLTGRYRLDSRDFLQLIEDHPEVDAFVRCDEGYPKPLGKVFTGAFAIRYKLFKEMLENLDLVKMEEQLIDIEVEVANFAQKLTARGAKVMYLEKIGMSANIGGPYPPVVSHW